MSQDYAAEAARYIRKAEVALTPGRRQEYLELAAKLERLAAIQQGLIPDGYTRDDGGERR